MAVTPPRLVPGRWFRNTKSHAADCLNASDSPSFLRATRGERKSKVVQINNKKRRRDWGERRKKDPRGDLIVF